MDSAPKIPYIVVNIGCEHYGIEAVSIRHLMEYELASELPDDSDFVEGLAVSRGDVVPVVELARRLGYSGGEAGHGSRLVVLEHLNRVVALRVDQAREFVEFEPDEIKPAPAAVEQGSWNFLSGVVEQPQRLVLLLDTEKLLAISKREART